MEKAELLKHGFVERTYPGQEGVFLVKEAEVWDFPYAREHIADGERVYGASLAKMEITPDGDIQFTVEDAFYIEGPYPIASDEGQGLLKDALAAKVSP
jgi:hypothetical protein